MQQRPGCGQPLHHSPGEVEQRLVGAAVHAHCVQQLHPALLAEPETRNLAGPDNRERLGRELARELVLAGPNPVFDRLARVLVEEQSGSASVPLDAVVVARSAAPQQGETQDLLAGVYSALAAASVPTVGVETAETAVSAIPVFHRRGLATVEGVDTVGLLLAEIGHVDGVVAPSVSHPPPGCCR